jgi:hypothetical protein
MPKKSKEIPNVARICDCWLDVGRCFCDEDDKHRRFTVRDKNNDVRGRFENLNMALQFGRVDFQRQFIIYDELEERTIIDYE